MIGGWSAGAYPQGGANAGRSERGARGAGRGAQGRRPAVPLRAAVPTWPAFHALALLSASPDAQATCLLLCAQRTGSGEGRISRRHTLKFFARNAAHPQMRAKLTQLLQLTKLFDNINPFTEAEVGDWVLPDEVRSATRENAHDTVRSGTTARAAVARA